MVDSLLCLVMRLKARSRELQWMTQSVAWWVARTGSSVTGAAGIGVSLVGDHETRQADRDRSRLVSLCHEKNRRDHATEVVPRLPHGEPVFQL